MRRHPIKYSDNYYNHLPPTSNDYSFEAKLDCHQFLPTDLSVSFDEHFLTVEAKHDEKEDSHGFVTRHFIRRYRIPKGTSYEDVQCELGNNGVLRVVILMPGVPKRRPLGIPIPKVIKEDEGMEFSVDIHHFSQDEVSARLVDEFIVVEAKHEEKPDNGNGGGVTREFVKKYHLPQGTHWDDIICNIGDDGVLHVIVPKMKKSRIGGAEGGEKRKGKILPIYYNPVPH